MLDLYANNLLTGKTYNVYLDKYGYAIGVDLHTGEDNYVFITGYDLDSSAIASGTARDHAALWRRYLSTKCRYAV